MHCVAICVAVSCSVLQCLAVSCRVLHCLAVSCSVLKCLAVRALFCDIYSVLQCLTVTCTDMTNDSEQEQKEMKEGSVF